MLALICLLVAAVCFGLAVFGVSARAVPLGLLAWVLATLLPTLTHRL